MSSTTAAASTSSDDDEKLKKLSDDDNEEESNKKVHPREAFLRRLEEEQQHNNKVQEEEIVDEEIKEPSSSSAAVVVVAQGEEEEGLNVKQEQEEQKEEEEKELQKEDQEKVLSTASSTSAVVDMVKIVNENLHDSKIGCSTIPKVTTKTPILVVKNDHDDHDDDDDDESKMVMDYLTKCGLSSSDDISLEKFDKSSLAFIIDLSTTKKSSNNDDVNVLCDDRIVEKEETKISVGGGGGGGGESKHCSITQPLDQKVVAERTDGVTHHDFARKLHDYQKEENPRALMEGGGGGDRNDKKNMTDISIDNDVKVHANPTDVGVKTSALVVENQASKVQSLYEEYTSRFSTPDLNVTHNQTIINTTATTTTATTSNVASLTEDQQQHQATTTTTTMQNLEPWQKELLRRMDQQQQTLDKVQAQIDAIAKLVVETAQIRDDAYTRKLEILLQQSQRNLQSDIIMPTEVPLVQERDNDGSSSSSPPLPPLPPQTTHLDQTETPVVQQQQEHRGLLLILASFLENIIDKVFYIPRMVYNYIRMTRIVRLIKHIQHEAANHNMPGGVNARFLDWNLVFKIIFVSFVFGKRMNKQQRVRDLVVGGGGGGDDDDDDATWMDKVIVFWVEHRVSIFVCCAIVTYILQTGLGRFLYKVFVKDNIIMHIWRNEDLLDHTNDNDDNDDDNNEDEDAQEQQNQHDADGNNVDRPRRRGRRDPELAPAVANANGNNNDRGIYRLIMGVFGGGIYQQFQNTFFAGVVRGGGGGGHQEREGNAGRNNDQVDNENQNAPPHDDNALILDWVVDFFRDILYLFGSLFLSLFPMWHPRAQIIQPPVVVHQDNRVPLDPPVRIDNDGGEGNENEEPNNTNNETGPRDDDDDDDDELDDGNVAHD